MSYSINGADSIDMQYAHSKLLDLHSAIHPRVRNHNLDLHPRWQKSSIVSQQSVAATPEDAPSAVLTYFRSMEQAQMVERLMGKETGMNSEVDTYRHPVIEVRLTPDHFAVELVLSPYAWWDQQNLVGKLDLPQHRSAFRNLLRGLGPDMRFGFWCGTMLDEMHLTTSQLLKGRVLDEWMATFTDGQDWLRIGQWYDLEEPMLDSNFLLAETFETIKALHPIYAFLLWTSNNNFHSFYEKRQRPSRRHFA